MGPGPQLPGLDYVRFSPGHVGLRWESWDPDSDLARFYADRYLSMAENSAADLGAALRLLGEPGRLPAVMFCHAGRDRTGVLAAFVLTAVGVPDHIVADDYALSTEAEVRYLAYIRRTASADPDPPHTVATPREAMLLFLADLRARHGGDLRNYLADCGVTGDVAARLRRALVDP